MQSANEMVVEQRPALKTFQESAAAPIKSILFVVHDDDGLEARLQAALSLARACSAHLKLLQVIPTASYTIVDPLGANFASAAIVEALEVQAAEVRNRLELHHMAVLPYRKCVKRRLEPEESLLEAKGIAARKQVMSR